MVNSSVVNPLDFSDQFIIIAIAVGFLLLKLPNKFKRCKIGLEYFMKYFKCSFHLDAYWYCLEVKRLLKGIVLQKVFREICCVKTK